MRLSSKQALMMLDVLKASLQIPESFGGYPLEIRQKSVHNIINQQSDDLVALTTEDSYGDWQESSDNLPPSSAEEEADDMLTEVMLEAEEILRQAQQDEKRQDDESKILPHSTLLPLLGQVRAEVDRKKARRQFDGRTREARAIYKALDAVETVIESEPNCPSLWLEKIYEFQTLSQEGIWMKSNLMNKLIAAIRNGCNEDSDNQQV